MRIYVSADIEGVAGVASRQNTNPQGFEYAAARKWMTDEVLAVIAGAEAAGARSFVVSDSHGNGQNLLPDAFGENTELVRSWPRPLGMMEAIDRGPFHAAALIGYHASVSCVSGTLAHSFSTAGVAALAINGEPASELRFCAALAGRFGTPVVLVSGDDAFVEEARQVLGDVEAVVTKQSLGWHSALTKTPAHACRLLSEAAERAFAKPQARPLFRIDGPVHLDVEFVSRRAAETLSFLRGMERTGARSIRYVATDILDATRFVSFLLFFRLTDQ